MKLSDVKKLPLGAYIVEWKSGGQSVATIGMTAYCGRWFAPSNWVAPSSDVRIWRLVKELKPLSIK